MCRCAPPMARSRVAPETPGLEHELPAARVCVNVGLFKPISDFSHFGNSDGHSEVTIERCFSGGNVAYGKLESRARDPG